MNGFFDKNSNRIQSHGLKFLSLCFLKTQHLKLSNGLCTIDALYGKLLKAQQLFLLKFIIKVFKMAQL
jgi:hypothetical protein